MGFFVVSELFKDTLVYSSKSRIDETHTYSTRLERASLSLKKSMGFSVYSGEWNNSRKKKRRTTLVKLSFWLHWILFGEGLGWEEKPHSDHTVPQKAPYETKWKRNQDAVHWVSLKEAQDQGFEFWQTKSFAIMTYFTIPRDCTDPCDFSRWRSSTFRTACDTKARTHGHVEADLAKPAAAATAAAASAHITHRRTLYLETESNGKARQKCKTTRKHIAEADQATKNLGHNTSDMNVDTHLSDKEVSTDALVNNEVVKEKLNLYSRRSGEGEDGDQPRIQPSYLRDR